MAGRPLKFKTPEVMQEMIDRYFADCDAREKPYTISGLAYALNTNRETLLAYQARDTFADTVTRAKARIEAFVEESLWLPKIATGVAFNLKNNFGWRDQSAVELTGKDGGPVVVKLEGKLEEWSK